MYDNSRDGLGTAYPEDLKATTFGLETMPTRRRYAVWGQCPDCLDCFTIEIGAVLWPGAPDIEDILLGRAGGRICLERIGSALQGATYRLSIRTGTVRLCPVEEGWSIFHGTCTKPFRVLSLQERVSTFWKSPTSEEVDDSDTDGSAGNGRSHEFWK